MRNYNNTLKINVWCVSFLIFAGFASQAIAAISPDADRTFSHPSEDNQTKNLTLTAGTYTFRTDANPNGNHWVQWYNTYSGSTNPLEEEHLYYYDDHDFSITSSGWVRAEIYDNNWNWQASYRWYITVNRPPYKASSPSPSHTSTNRSVSSNLDWSGSDPDGDSVQYKVYFGTDSGPDSSEYKTTRSNSDYNLPTLAYKTKYYWRIDTTDGKATTTGSVWNFTTGGSLPVASRKSPTSSSVPLNLGDSQKFVVWGEDPDGGLDYVKWYVNGVLKQTSGGYIDFEGKEGDDAFSYTFNSASTYTVRALIYDDDGNTDDITWTISINRPPYQPGRIWVEDVTNNSVKLWWGSATDPDGDSVTYLVQYNDDGAIDGWNPTNPTPTSSITTTLNGLEPYTNYHIRVTAVDDKGLKTELTKNNCVRTQKKAAMTPTYDKADKKFEFSAGVSTSDPALSDRIPVILVHGAGSDMRPVTLNYWYWWVENNSESFFNADRYAGMFKVYRFVYDSSDYVANNGQKLSDFVKAYPELANKKVVLMAHSMGGLICRYAMNTDDDFGGQVLKLVTLGTPHLGSPGANPTWVFSQAKSWGDHIVYDLGFGGISPGDYGLAWHNPNELPTEAADYRGEALDRIACKESLLDNSISNPFAGTPDMANRVSDGKIIAFGGYFNKLLGIDGLGNDVDETSGNHLGLSFAEGTMQELTKRDGTHIAKSDGMVPLESALFATNDIEYINITDDAIQEEVDHVSYLDVPQVMDYIMSFYIWDIAKKPYPVNPTGDKTVYTQKPALEWSLYGDYTASSKYHVKVYDENGIKCYDSGEVPNSATSHTLTQSLDWNQNYEWEVKCYVQGEWTKLSSDLYLASFRIEMPPNEIPIAQIDQVSPNPAQPPYDTIDFYGTGSDSTDPYPTEIVEWQWSSDIDGVLGTSEDISLSSNDLTVGVHTISFRVKDERGEWSVPATSSLTVSNALPTAQMDPIPSPLAPGEKVLLILGGQDNDENYESIVNRRIWVEGILVNGNIALAQYEFTAPSSEGTWTLTLRYEVQDDEGSTASVEQQFQIIIPVDPPSSPFCVSPENGSDGQPIDSDLIWLNGGGATSYNVYMGTDNPPTNIVNGMNQTETTFDPGVLDYDTPYYWRIVALNSVGSASDGVWTFRTEVQMVTVPDVTGMTQQDAEEAILAAGLTVGERTYRFNDTVPQEVVTDQIPSARSSVSFGSSVDLVISLGERPDSDINKGCTPRFWKENSGCWCSAYAPDTPVSIVFTALQSPAYASYADEKCDFDADTLLDALNYRGGRGLEGAARNLLRHATAALLNICNDNVNYPVWEALIIDLTNAVLATEDTDFIQELHSVLAEFNDYGCPIDVPNTAPIAMDDVYTATMDTVLNITDAASGVLQNDYDPEGNSITVSLVDGTSLGGIISLNSDGTFSYTPPTSVTGMDSFTYYVSDGYNNSNTASVTISITAP